MITRRFTADQSLATLTAVEGIVIIDAPPPGPISADTGSPAALVGEFADMTYAVKIDTAGVVSTDCRPTEVFGAQDLVTKFGGFDSTIGDFGDHGGNGFHALRNKRFFRLVCAAINLCSAEAGRAWRELPTAISASNPNPAVPVVPGIVAAGRPFVDSNGNVVRAGKTISFTASTPLISGTDGAVSSGTAAVTTLTSAGSNFTTAGVSVGDILVFGIIGTPSWAGTFRVVSVGTTTLTFQKMDGSLLTATTVTSQPFRIHPRTDADTSGGAVAYTTSRITGSDGSTASATATSHTFTSAGSDFTAAGVVAGDLLQLLTGTYKVLTAGTTTLTYGKLDGSSFTMSSASSLTFAVVARVTTGSALQVPVRALASVPLGTVMTASSTTDTAAATATTWLPLSGLRLSAVKGFTYTAAVQAANAATTTELNALYGTAIDAMKTNRTPISECSLIWSARHSDLIAGYLKQHALDASAIFPAGRIAIVSPDLTDVTLANLINGSSWPSVGSMRTDRVIFAWPGVRAYVPEAQDVSIEVGDGTTVTDGTIDECSDSWMASILSILPPANNPGQNAEPVRSLMAPVTEFQRAVTSIALTTDNYVTLKQNGIAAPILNDKVGTTFESGVVASITPGQKNISRRRMTDSIQAGIVEVCLPYSKLPMNETWQANVNAAVNAYMGRRADKAPDQSKRDVKVYLVDTLTANTPASLAAGVFYVLVYAEIYATGDSIVLKTAVSENSVVPVPVG